MKQWRAAALLVGCASFLVAASAWAPPLPSDGWAAWWSWLQADPQRGLAVLAGGAGWLLAAWLLLVTSLVLLGSSAHTASQAAGRAAELLAPRIVRGLLEAMLGTALAVGSAAPALAGATAVTATSQPTLAPVPAPVVAPPELPPLLDLDRLDVQPVRPTPPAATPARRRPAAKLPATAIPPTTAYRVRPGDTLWGLAAARLPTDSSAERITRGWQQWYLANREQIGPDPGLLLVGESLVAPRGLS